MQYFLTHFIMETTFFHKNLDQKEIGKFNKYVETKTDMIENLLTKFAEDAKVLKISIQKFEKHDAYEVELRLNLPGKVLVAKEASHQITKAVDLSKDRLMSQIKKHVAHLRKARSLDSVRGSQPSKMAAAYTA